jgi:nucleotide-binding universal stress UspA family protein
MAANELTADRLVVGARGLSAIERFFLSSTSATLRAHPPTSVLVARRAGDRR